MITCKYVITKIYGGGWEMMGSTTVTNIAARTKKIWNKKLGDNWFKAGIYWRHKLTKHTFKICMT